MKNLLISIFLTVLLAASLTAQVTVSQTFLDDANAAFREVVTLRAANTALLKANESLDKANDANALAVMALTSANETLKADNADLRKLKCDQTTFLIFLVKIKRCK